MVRFSTPLIERTKEYVAGFIGDNFTEKICYHNIDHTLEVVDACVLIGSKCRISDKELETVVVAAWFHDTGYYLGCENHEEASVEIAQRYLAKEHVKQEVRRQIANCILATKIPQKPQNILEEILCDADLFHLSSEKFFEKSELLLRELTYQNIKITPDAWTKKSKEFVEAHKYHTPYGKKILYPLLKKNLALL
ncbi:MAG: HD domain-containing protein [Cytophagales bacterium]|nr:HD domain-containing protein [Cytophagales bacterium]